MTYQKLLLLVTKKFATKSNLSLNLITHTFWNTNNGENILSQRLLSDWNNFDKWTYDGQHNFTWGKDSLVDMIYMVYRQHRPFLFDGTSTGYVGIATLSECSGDTNYRHTVFKNSTSVVRIVGMKGFQIDADNLGINSGVRVHAGYSKFSRQRFLDLVTHEHGHYFFGSWHNDYGKLNSGSGEFSLSPWESVKLDFINPKIINYTNETNYLYDYSSHGGSAGTEGEVIQIPVSTDGKEFFLLANRRKVAQWDSRTGGDTLADDKWQHFKGANYEYGKGLYIYHVTNGYWFSPTSGARIDLECADGLWNWKYAGFSRPDIKNPNNLIPVMIKTTPGYDNDNPSISDTASKDEMSERKLINGIHVTSSFSPGSHDISYSQRGTSSLYTNENDYWYSLANLGDRWDAWNTGYNEIFSPYSSPNTNDMNNQPTGIFVWYDSLETGTNKARIKIYRESGIGGITPLNTILEETPPSKPVGIRIEFDTTDAYRHPIIKWNHNKEPDMLRDGNVKRYKIFKASKADMTQVPSDYVLLAVKDIPDSLSPEYTDTTVLGPDAAIVYDPCYPVQYPLKYKVVAVDNTDKESVKSDFAQTYGWRSDSSVTCAIGPDNPGIGSNNEPLNESTPAEYSLKQNYPNPFNPATKIKYDLPNDNFVTIKIYDILGKELLSLVNEFKPAGSYSVTFDAANYPSGVYYYKIKTGSHSGAGSFVQVRKMILIK